MSWFGRKRNGDESRFGALIVRMGLITDQQLQEALEKQKAVQQSQDERLGFVLMDMGLITKTQMECALGFQKAMRKGRGMDVMVDMINWKTKNLLGPAVANGSSRG